jgi:LacI family transcriptional regulator
VNRTIDRGGVAAVIPDDHAGMALAVDHLYGLGHRTIGHVAGPRGTSTGSRRADGFETAIRALGLQPGPIVEAGAFTEEGGRTAGIEVRSGRARPSAIVAANDLIALGVLDAAARLGLRCPDDVSLVGFNDMPFVDRLQPPLTTVRVDEYELGLRASRILLSFIDDPATHREAIMLTPDLVVRGSTAPPATSLVRERG